jgi:putative spermidine/putrescine transport system substrate-binding protein
MFMSFTLNRRSVVGGIAFASLTGAGAEAQAAKPKAPLVITVIDAAGSLALTQPAFEKYRRAKPDHVSRFAFTKAPAPELPGKLKAQQGAGRVDIDIVLGGTDVVSTGVAQELWTPLFPQHAAGLPKPQDIFDPNAMKMQAFTSNQALCIAYTPSGPLLEYMPEKVKKAPTTAQELMDWCKQNPNRFCYARPSNSGPARTFLMGLPYILGDSDPKEPMKGWDKTWAYLKELNNHIEYYPTGTGVTMKELGEGTRDMITSTMGWDINPRVLGIVPKEAKITTLQGFHWIGDAHYAMIPRGIPVDRLPVLLDVVSYLLSKESQALAWDEGYLYPGPSVKDVPLSMAPEANQATLKEFGRPEYEKLMADAPFEAPLEPNLMVQAFRRWDEEVAGAKKR